MTVRQSTDLKDLALKSVAASARICWATGLKHIKSTRQQRKTICSHQHLQLRRNFPVGLDSRGVATFKTLQYLLDQFVLIFKMLEDGFNLSLRFAVHVKVRPRSHFCASSLKILVNQNQRLQKYLDHV